MYVVFSKDLQDLDGNSIQQEGKAFTIQSAVCNALTAAFGDTKVSGEEKLNRFNLALRIKAKEGFPVELSIEEASLIKRLINDCYPSPLVVGQVWKHLEASSEKIPLKEAAE